MSTPETSRGGSLSSKPTMMVSPSPKPKMQLSSDKPDIPLKPTSPVLPKPALSAKPKLLLKPVMSPPGSPAKPSVSPKSPPPTKPPKPMSPTAAIPEPLTRGSTAISAISEPDIPDHSPGDESRARASSSVVLRRKKRSSGSPAGSPSQGRRYSVAVMGQNGEVSTSSSHDVRKDVEVQGEEVWKKNTSFYTPGYSLFFPPIPQNPNSPHYPSHSAIFRALDLVPDELTVLQGFQFTRHTFNAFVSHECDKSGGEVEGGCDFVVLSENQVVILDVKHGSDVEGVEGYQESVKRRAKVAKLVLRIIIKTFRFKMPAVKQFTVFPNVVKSAAPSSLSDTDKKTCLFSEDLQDFTSWWTSQFKQEKNKKDKEFHQAFERVKQTVFGIWSMGRDESEDYTISHCLNSLSTNLRTEQQRTAEIESLNHAVNKSGAVSKSDSVHHELHGVRPTLHLVSRREGHEEVDPVGLVSEVLRKEGEVLSGVESAVIVELTDSALCSGDCVRSYEIVTSREWMAVVAVVDLSSALRLSALRDGKKVDIEALLSQIKSVVSRVRVYFSLVVVIGATEIQGDTGFNEFGSETLNKTNRSYFQQTKSGISSLLQALVPHMQVKFYDTSTTTLSQPHRLSWSEISKKLGSMYQFPDKRLNREALLSVTQQIAAVETNILGLVSKVNTQKSATKNWGNLGSRNDELRRAKNTIGKLQDELSHMLEIHGKVAGQIEELSRSYDIVYKDVEANMD